MFDAGMTAEGLRACLTEIMPIELKGMALLRERRSRLPGQFFPTLTGEANGIQREKIAEAVHEIVQYTERCNRAAEQLMKLAPIPITAFSVLEYGLVRRMAA